MDTKRLRAKMALFGDTGGDLAKYLEISPQRFSAKLNETNGAEFTQSEIFKIKKKYQLEPKEIDAIFFGIKVSKKDTKEV